MLKAGWVVGSNGLVPVPTRNKLQEAARSSIKGIAGTHKTTTPTSPAPTTTSELNATVDSQVTILSSRSSYTFYSNFGGFSASSSCPIYCYALHNSHDDSLMYRSYSFNVMIRFVVKLGEFSHGFVGHNGLYYHHGSATPLFYPEHQ